MRDSWITVERGLPKLMDGGVPDSNANVLWVPPSGLYTTFYQFELGFAQIQNRSAVTSPVGVGARIARPRWRAGQIVGSTTYTDDTADAQSSAAADFPLETLIDNSGFLVASVDEFNVIDLLIATASVGGVPVRTLSYSGPAGWSAITNALVMPVSAGHWAAAETLIWFYRPPDWTAMTVALHGTGVPVGMKGIRVLSTTAPTTTAGVATSMSIAQAINSIEGLADNVIYSSPLGQGGHKFDCGADALVGVIGTALAQNAFLVNVRCV